MSSTTSSVSIPSGYSLPYAVVTDTDHEAWIVIATALGVCWILLFAAIRIFIRWTVSPGVGLDDATLAAATVFTIIQSSLVLHACSDGLGKSIELVPSSLRSTVQKLYYSSTLFFIIGLGLSKLSVAFFIRRLSQAKHHRRVFNAAPTLVGVWTIASIFAVALQCDLSHPWLTVGEKCPGAFLRWQAISAFDIAIEIALVGMVIYLVWDLQAPMTKKAVVVGAMIIPIAFRLATFDERGWTTDPMFHEGLFIVWTQAELTYSVIAATIPALRPMMHNLTTHFGGLGNDSGGYGYGYGRNEPGSYQMSNMGTVNKSKTRDQQSAQKAVVTLEGRDTAYPYDAWAPSTGAEVNSSQTGAKRSTAKQVGGDATSVESNDSRRMFIRKDTSFHVAYEDQGPVGKSDTNDTKKLANSAVAQQH